jgi:hypothetical protein
MNERGRKTGRTKLHTCNFVPFIYIKPSTYANLLAFAYLNNAADEKVMISAVVRSNNL